MCVIDHAPDIRDEIATERLNLRRARTSDAAAIVRLASDFAICSMSTRMPFPYGLGDAEAFVRLVSAQKRERENTFVIDNGDDGVVGVLGFHQPPDAPLEMGYWIGRPYWGRGYATEAARAALGWAGNDWRRKMVVAGHFADNAASANVLVKSGFLYTGEVQKRHSRARRKVVATRMMVWLA
ncbi:MAG: GCN5-related N-acetyltransferase [Caulobacteraceae bacterium]|nr:GCN5-related N-acetyltransferase [Caulobacteraceae bacterium]